jgi:hypothetical protein
MPSGDYYSFRYSISMTRTTGTRPENDQEGFQNMTRNHILIDAEMRKAVRKGMRNNWQRKTGGYA